MKKYFINLFIAVMMVIASLSAAFAGAPAGTTGAPPTTMIGPLTATKLELVDNSGSAYTVGSVLALNTSAATAFIEFWDQPCAGVVLGTTKPSWIQPVQATNWSYIDFNAGMGFFTPICVVAVTAPNGTVGSGASVFMQVFFP
jgi:hypothetical protein